MPLPTIRLAVSQDSNHRPVATLGGQDITSFLAKDGLSIVYEGNPLGTPTVQLTFAPGRLQLDFDVDLLEQLLEDQQVTPRLCEPVAYPHKVQVSSEQVFGG